MGGQHGAGLLDVDRLARGDTWLHRRDARAKTVAALALIVAASAPDAAGSWKILAVALVAFFASATAGIPLEFIVRRVALALPFLIIFVAAVPLLPGPIEQNAIQGGLIVARALAAILVATLLGA